MKSLKESLFESIFGNNVKSDIVYHGEKVDEKVWTECEKSFKWFRKNIVGKGNSVDIGSGSYDVIYNESDCVILKDNIRRTTFICPETIWYNYVKGALKKIQTSGNEIIDDPRDVQHGTCTFYNMTFAKRPSGKIYYSIDCPGEKCFGYTPETISDKAKKIIEKY